MKRKSGVCTSWPATGLLRLAPLFALMLLLTGCISPEADSPIKVSRKNVDDRPLLIEDVAVFDSRSLRVIPAQDVLVEGTRSINIFDRQLGAEGLQGVGTIYRSRHVAVPSPATLTLLGLGLAGIVGRPRKRAS